MLQRKAHKNNKDHSEEDNIKESFLQEKNLVKRKKNSICTQSI